MNVLIVYASSHHQNTQKLVDAICERYPVKAVKVTDTHDMDLESYDVIGLASGIAFGKFYPTMERFAQEQLPHGKKVFFLYTCGRNSRKYTESITHLVEERGGEILGAYGCLGFDTYGPFKLIGGIAKGHPTEEEQKGAAEFFARTVGAC